MFKFLSNWMDKSPEEHMKNSLSLIGISALAWGGSLVFPAAAPALVGISFAAAQLSMVEVGVGVGTAICDGVGWLFNKIFKRENKSNSQKIDPKKTQSRSNSNDKDHSDTHARDNILLQRMENDDNGQSVETPIMQPPIIPAQTANTQSLQSPGNQSTLLLQEINQLKNEVSQLRNRIQSLENDKRNLIKQNSELQEKISPSKNVTDFLGKRAENKTNGSLVPSNPTKGKMSTATAMALSGKSSETASH